MHLHFRKPCIVIKCSHFSVLLFLRDLFFFSAKCTNVNDVKAFLDINLWRRDCNGHASLNPKVRFPIRVNCSFWHLQTQISDKIKFSSQFGKQVLRVLQDIVHCQSLSVRCDEFCYYPVNKSKKCNATYNNLFLLSKTYMHMWGGASIMGMWKHMLSETRRGGESHWSWSSTQLWAIWPGCWGLS